MGCVLFKDILLTTVFTVAFFLPAGAAELSGSSSDISLSSAKVGPVSGNMESNDAKAAESAKPDNSDAAGSAGTLAETEVLDDHHPYGSSPAAKPAKAGTADSGGNIAGVPVTEETRGADTNGDGRATDSELDNAANGGDIHSMKR